MQRNDETNIFRNICIGTAQFGMDYGIANRSGKPAPGEILRLVKAAWGNGISYFDTAASYGSSEAVLGKTFSTLGIEDHVKVITKLSTEYEYQGVDHLKCIVDGHLERLRTRRLFGLLFHRTGVFVKGRKVFSDLKQLKHEGVIEHIGVSVYNPDEALAFAENPDVDIIQVPFNILDRRLPDRGFFELAGKNGKIIFIRSIYLQGLMLMDQNRILSSHMAWASRYLTLMDDFIQKQGCDPKTFALSGVRKMAPEAVLIIGLEAFPQLEENMEALMNEKYIGPGVLEEWWHKLPLFPERLVNPSLW